MEDDEIIIGIEKMPTQKKKIRNLIIKINHQKGKNHLIQIVRKLVIKIKAQKIIKD